MGTTARIKNSRTGKIRGGRLPLAVFGARSYTAGELLRLLATHPKLTPGFLVSRSAEGAGVDELQPHVAGCFPYARVGGEDQAFDWLAKHADAPVVLCTGSGESAPIAKRLADAGLLGGRRLVDLSGDFRLPNATLYKHWYERDHAAPELLGKFDYCIPELHRTKSKSNLVSNPGCFATAVQLSLAPALRAGIVEPDLRVSATTGSSGSGATPKPNTHHPFRAHEYYAYKPLAHQHLPEIRRGLGLDDKTGLALVTHSAPIVRGILATAMLKLKKGVGAEAMTAVYREFCAGEPMLRFVDGPPMLAGVTGTNLARIGVTVEGRYAAAFCAVDNLTRGASGQALQNLNRMLGLPETMGLDAPGMSPV